VLSKPKKCSAEQAVVDAIRRRLTRHTRPVLVAIDGPSGSGKSTFAFWLAEQFEAALIQTDDFFAAGISDAEWDARTAEQRAAGAIDWQRVRVEALEALLASKPAKWDAFDFAAGARPDGTYAVRSDVVEREPASVIVLDGAYSTGGALADLIDLTVLVDAPREVRHDRLQAREERTFLAAWHARWDAAEEAYFSQIRPRSSFDFVVDGAAT
jgi:anthranilate synthase component 1/para-aminobenzoate synthetase